MWTECLREEMLKVWEEFKRCWRNDRGVGGILEVWEDCYRCGKNTRGVGGMLEVWEEC